jgi:hypothetical protein
VAEVVCQFVDGHDFEQDMAKEPLPAVADDLSADRWEDALEGVEESVLSGVDGVDHAGRNSFPGYGLSIARHPGKSRMEQL